MNALQIEILVGVIFAALVVARIIWEVRSGTDNRKANDARERDWFRTIK